MLCQLSVALLLQYQAWYKIRHLNASKRKLSYHCDYLVVIGGLRPSERFSRGWQQVWQVTDFCLQFQLCSAAALHSWHVGVAGNWPLSQSCPLTWSTPSTCHTCRLRCHKGCGLRQPPHVTGGFGSLQNSIQFGATAVSPGLSDSVLPAGGAAFLITEHFVFIQLILHKFSQPTQWLGTFPCRWAAAAKRVGAADRKVTHLSDHVGDVVTVTDEATANDRLQRNSKCHV